MRRYYWFLRLFNPDLEKIILKEHTRTPWLLLESSFFLFCFGTCAHVRLPKTWTWSTRGLAALFSSNEFLVSIRGHTKAVSNICPMYYSFSPECLKHLGIWEHWPGRLQKNTGTTFIHAVLICTARRSSIELNTIQCVVLQKRNIFTPHHSAFFLFCNHNCVPHSADPSWKHQPPLSSLRSEQL